MSLRRQCLLHLIQTWVLGRVTLLRGWAVARVGERGEGRGEMEE